MVKQVWVWFWWWEKTYFWFYILLRSKQFLAFLEVFDPDWIGKPGLDWHFDHLDPYLCMRSLKRWIWFDLCFIIHLNFNLSMVSTVNFSWLFVSVVGSKIVQKSWKLLTLKKIYQTNNRLYIINRSRFILVGQLIFLLMHTRSGCIQLIDWTSFMQFSSSTYCHAEEGKYYQILNILKLL